MPMANYASVKAQWPGQTDFSALVSLAFLGPDEEHVALLVDLRRCALLRRWDNLLDEGVAAVFGLSSGEAELLALSFQAEEFTPDRAGSWLAERGIQPLLFLPNSGRLASAKPNPPLAVRKADGQGKNSAFPPRSGEFCASDAFGARGGKWGGGRRFG
jgi:hypothetical protein